MGSLTQRIAEFVACYRPEDVPDRARDIAKACMLDGLGVGCLGASLPIAQILFKYLELEGTSGSATVVGWTRQVSPSAAAFANGVLIHAEDFDDMGGGGGHPTAVLLPAILATGQELGSSGKDAIAAYVVGYEVSTALASSLAIDKPFHPTAIVGPIGAAVACAWLRRLSAERVAIAMGIAASCSSGIRRNFGTFCKPMHAGNAARSGLLAAQLAELGWDADPEIIEARQGFADCYGGERCNLGFADYGLGQLYRIMMVPSPRPTAMGPIIKPWPCCGGNNGALTALFEIIRKVEFDSSDIEAVDITLPSQPDASALFRNNPDSGFQGKFGMPYVIAAALLDRSLTVDSFQPATFQRVNSSDLMSRVNIRVDTQHQLRTRRNDDGRGFAAVTVRLRDGRVYSGRCEGPGDGLEGQSVVEKFMTNAVPLLGPRGAEELRSAVEQLEQLPNVNTVASLTSSPGRR